MQRHDLKVIKILFLLILGILVALHCAPKPKGLGSESEIIVVADSLDWVFLKNPIKATFEKEILTPHPEKIFSIKQVDPEELERYSVWRNLILLSTLKSQGAAAQLVKKMLSAEARAKVKEGKGYVFTKQNPWAEEQLLMVLVANDLKTLKTKLNQNREFLFNIFDEYLNEVTEGQMFNRLEQVEVEKELLKKYGWMVKIQHDYFIALEEPEDNFVMLRRRFPERWLYVLWVDTDDPSLLTPEWCIEKRKQVGVKFYDNDEVVDEYTSTKEVEFWGRRAIRVEGIWENDEKVAGGPFRSYCFYDEGSQRIYTIDLAVFNPGSRKEPFLRQLDIIARSFKTREELTASTGSRR